MIINVQLADRSYPVYVNGKLSFVGVLKKMFPANAFFVITNKTVENYYSPTLKQWEKELPLTWFSIDDGEKYKTVSTINAILDLMFSRRMDRNTVVIAFGGGVVGDMAGFTASVFLRGVPYIQIPTTLLSMVDSSVGGKTGVNHAMGKNLIGTFYQPKLVWIDTSFLKTLSKREFCSGYAEVVKYGFIGGRETFDFIKNHCDAIIANDEKKVEEAIKRSLEIKAAIVSEDERETGNRALLNLGHTFGHALESFYNYEGILHGEGVFRGIICAVKLSKRLKGIASNDMPEYEAIISKIKLPLLPGKPDINKIYESMFSDKKVIDGKIRFVLPKEPGTSIIVTGIKGEEVKKVMEEVFR